MQRFSYKAKTRDGTKQEGKVEARDLNSAVGVLRERGLVVIDVKAVNEGSGLTFASRRLQKAGLDDVVAFTRQLATMISSGLPLTEALSILEIQSKPVIARIVSEILRDVQTGSTVADALQKHGDTFSSVYISLVLSLIHI